MGQCQSEEVRQQVAAARRIDNELVKYHFEDMQIIKMLLLGAGESGKTTILKQIKLLQESGFSEEDMNEQRQIVYGNTVQAMLALLAGVDALGIHLEEIERESNNKLSESFSDEVARALAELWRDKGVLEAYARRHEFALHDSAAYFLNSLERIRAPTYRPSEQDILHTRVRTTGITELNFVMHNTSFRVVDVGGQRSERRKWIHCFDDCSAVVFIFAMSEFDQTLLEDPSVNRMVEAMNLYASILNNPYFMNSAMILFLNKRDLFEEKIKKVSIRVLFDDYTGGPIYEECFAFIESQLTVLQQDPAKQVYMHRTCATDTNQMQLVLANVMDLLIEKNLQTSGML